MAINTKVKSADIARIAGVSRATVSYVLNNRSDQTISEETRERIRRAVEATGYRPNSAARALATGKTFTVALWVPSPNRSVYGHVIEQVMRLAKADGYHIVVVQVSGETPETLSTVHQVDSMSVDGILALDATELVESTLDRFPNAPSVVSMGPAYSKKVDHVGVDLKAGSLIAMRHLTEQGYRRIAYAVHCWHQYPGDPRFDAYAEVLAEIGGEIDLLPMDMPFRHDAYEAVKQRFARSDRPDALFCFNDDCAIGANKALYDLGLRVPQDVAVIGSDGIDETIYAVPAISTVAQPFEEMCALAWAYLQNRINDPASPLQSSVLPMRLNERASTINATKRIA